MVKLDAVAAATIVSGLISGLAAYAGYRKQVSMNRKFKRELRRGDWYREVNHIASELQRYTYKQPRDATLVITQGEIDYDNSSSEVEEMKELADRLLEKRNKPPIGIENNVLTEINELCACFETPYAMETEIATYNDLTEVVYNKAHDIKTTVSGEIE